MSTQDIPNEPFDFGSGAQTPFKGAPTEPVNPAPTEPVNPGKSVDEAPAAPVNQPPATGIRKQALDTSAIDEGMAGDGSVTLPFVEAFFYTINGDARMKTAAEQGAVPEAMYFGGFAVDADSLVELADSLGQTVPLYMGKPTEIPSTEGNKTFRAYAVRSLIVAPICIRQSWISGDGKVRTAEYVDGARSHAQVVCMAGQPTTKGIQAFGPIVLTGKGYQAGNILDGFSTWKRASAKARRAHAENVSPWCFWVQIGTFGQRTQRMVGTSTQHAITPVHCNMPKEITAQMLQALYVGDDVVSQMAEIAVQCKDWREAWREGSEVKTREDAGGAAGPGAAQARKPEPPPAGSFDLKSYLNQ